MAESALPDFDLRVSPRTVQQGTVDKLRMAILTGKFQPGSRLVESQLCTQLGVSRPSLREALRSLEAERLIEITPNKGPSVPTLSWEQANEIYEVRALLEAEAAARCAERITPPQLAALEQALLAFEDAATQGDDARRITTTADFYAVIMANCGNTVLDELHGGLLARINFFRGRSMSLRGRAANSMREMRAIFEAIVARDPNAARMAARKHVLKARAAVKEAMARGV